MRIEIPGRTALPLIILALASLVGLDYVALQKGDPTWLFSAPRPAAAPRAALEAVLQDELQSLSIEKERISRYRDPEGIPHIMIDLTIQEYQKLEPRLQDLFTREGAQIFRQEEEREGGERFDLWKISRTGQSLSLLLKRQQEPPPPPEKPRTGPRGRVALIMDDMGNSLEAIYDLCALNRPMTVAVLPHSPLARETASIARDNNLEVILHLPLESLNNDYDNTHTAGLIHSRMSREEIVRIVEDSLGRVPFIKGVNTHMGSKITADPRLMGIILENIKGRGLYFIDSRTTAESVAYDLARDMGIPSAFRHVFLDSEFEEESIKRQLRKLFQRARDHGQAVGICHPSPQTMKVLRENLHLLAEYDLEAVRTSALIR